MSAARDIVVGDVHGCLGELDELLRLVDYRAGGDRLAFVGDLVDRGPDSVGVVRRARELGAPCVMGNHDEWYARCLRHENRVAGSSARNPLRKNEKKYALYCLMSRDDLEWLSILPLVHRLDARTVVIHAGMKPGIAPEAQDRQNLLRMRYLRRDTGEMANLDSEILRPDTHAFWTEVWSGPEDVVYGHHPSKTDTVLTEQNGVRCWGIDTGCCFGNKLTAWVRDDAGRVELVSVLARGQYAEWHKSMAE